MHLIKEIKLKDLAGSIGAVLLKETEYTVHDIAEPQTAGEKDIIYLADKKHKEAVLHSKACAVLTSPEFSRELPDDKIPLVSEKLQESIIRILTVFEDKDSPAPGVLERNIIDKSVKLGRDVKISPNVCLREDAAIGDGTVLYPFVYIGRRVRIGKKCIIMPGVTVYDGCCLGDNVIVHSGVVIGSDGFGYMQKDGKNIRIPHIGNVVIEDDVEIGANSTLDKATIRSTVIRKGVKIDNLVQIAHNVEIGENSIVAAQTGISGSSRIGKNCILLGQVGVADHAVIEDNVIVGAQTGVPSRTVRSDEKFIFGYPAKPLMQAKRIEAIVSKLPEFYKEFNELKKIVEEKLK
ncbi:MAG: UDP-3-O-(3-hydroxymyristoyl)glucosamine N-acyltransferase [bacterium]|nr:UDP-3-O-(3-hydroxymyristoyl)glucosamine N-acyltransferase [bacterium]